MIFFNMWHQRTIQFGCSILNRRPLSYHCGVLSRPSTDTSAILNLQQHNHGYVRKGTHKGWKTSFYRAGHLQGPLSMLPVWSAITPFTMRARANRLSYDHAFINVNKTRAKPVNVAAPLNSIVRRAGTRSFVQKWKFDVLSVFGCLVSERGYNMHVKVKPVDFAEYPDQKTVYVKLNSGDVKQGAVECFREDGCVFVTREKGTWEEEIKCLAEVPIKFDLDMKLHGRSTVAVEFLENESMFIRLQDGDCHIRDVKTGGISVITRSGNIRADGLLQGDADIQTESGEVSLNKPVCNKLEVTSVSGDLYIGSLYADKTHLQTECGNVHIRNAHRLVSVEVEKQGDVTIDTMDGSLNVKVNNGNVDVFLVQHHDVNIQVNTGNVRLKLPEGASSQVNLRAKCVEVDTTLYTKGLERSDTEQFQSVTGFLGPAETGVTEAMLTVRTGEGTISILAQDWLASLKLKGKPHVNSQQG